MYVVHKFVSIAKIRNYDLNELMALLRVVGAAAQDEAISIQELKTVVAKNSWNFDIKIRY